MATRSRPLIFVLLFVSGFTGLAYEFSWSKRLANLLGNSGQAHAIVLATFMGGLAAGAWLFGRTADRARRPLVVYGLLELGVGLYALGLPWVLEVLGRVYLEVAPGLEGLPRTTARLALASLTLVVPTLLMGGTLPAMMRHLAEHLRTARRELSLLYAVNSLGASVGCLLAGMVMVPVAGLTTSERFAAGLNLLLGMGALGLGFRAPLVHRAGVDPVPDVAHAYDGAAVRAALIGTALAGFTSMLYELTWIRLLAVILGGTSYAFTVILTAFIFGLSLGSFWLSTRPESDALRTFGWLQLGLVVAVCVGLPTYSRLPYFFLQLGSVLRHDGQAWFVYQGITFVFCATVLVPPTFLLGASFPSAARVAMASVDHVGGQLGRVYLWNTLGTVLGSLMGGLWLLPTIGLEGNIIVGLALNLTAAGVALWSVKDRGSRRLRLLTVAASVLLVVTVTASTHGWATMVAASGRAREWRRAFTSFHDFRGAVEARSTVRFYRDDVFASVLVGEQSGGRRYLRINGKVDASNGDDIDTQILAGHLGILTHPSEVKKVLLVGVGAGVTAGSILAHPIERLDVVEISPAVIDAARFFAPDNRDALSDPRCHVHLEDARTFLMLSRETYDLIVSVPSNPWVSGVSGLFSRDFFRVAREHLAEGGRVVQWIHTYESNEAMLKLVLRTLRDSFEHGTTWVGPEDLVMIASRAPQHPDFEVMRQRLARPSVSADLARIRVHEVTTLLARQVHSDGFQKHFGGEGRINTDDHNLLEYGSPIAFFAASEIQVPDERTNATHGAALELSRWTKEQPLTAAQLEDAWRSLSWVHPAESSLVRSVAEAWLDRAPDSKDAAVAVTRSALASGDVSRAHAVLGPLVAQGEREPEVVSQWLLTRRAEARRERAPWRPVDVSDAVELGRSVLAEQPDAGSVREQLEKLESLR